MRIAIVTHRKEALGAFASGLATQEVEIDWVPTPEAAVHQARVFPRDMVIFDDPTGGFRASITALMKANALIHTAVITPMDPERFHTESEGLGILTSLPPSPNAEHAQYLLSKVRELMGS